MTNHAVVAMVGDDVKQTRCTTCDAEHEYKHAKVPRQRRKGETPAALYNHVAAGAPKRVAPSAPDSEANPSDDDSESPFVDEPPIETTNPDPPASVIEPPAELTDAPEDDERDVPGQDEGPVHRPLIRASLPRPEGQQPPARPIPEFTIRQPGGGRPNRFRPRHQRGGQGGQGGQNFQFGNRSNGNNMGGSMRGPRHQHGGGGRPGGGMKRHGPGGNRKRSK
ncbi:MAG TPA: hypothetical protein VH583_03500 [Vicinamibacterales bacterium]